MKVTGTEYDGYTPEHPELIPTNEQDARDKLKTLTESVDLALVDHTSFVIGWWALFWLFPGLHPDGWEDWDSEFHIYAPLANEAFRRCDAGKITDDQLYPAEATHNRIWREQQAIAKGQGSPVEPNDERVLIRNSEGLYLARNEAGEIAWVWERSKAFRYFRKADAVDAQVREVKRQYDQEWTIELSDPRGEDLAGMRVLILAGPDTGEKGVCLGSAPGGLWTVSTDASSATNELVFEKEFILLVGDNQK